MTEDQFSESLREIDPLLLRIDLAMRECVERGVEPEVLLLGPEEFRSMELWANGRADWRDTWFKTFYGPSGPATKVPLYFQGLRVERSEVPGVRVGWVSLRH